MAMVFDALCLKTKTEIQINTTCLQIVFSLKKIQKKRKNSRLQTTLGKRQRDKRKLAK